MPWARQSFAEALGLHVDGSGTSGHLSCQRPGKQQPKGKGQNFDGFILWCWTKHVAEYIIRIYVCMQYTIMHWNKKPEIKCYQSRSCALVVECSQNYHQPFAKMWMYWCKLLVVKLWRVWLRKIVILSYGKWQFWTATSATSATSSRNLLFSIAVGLPEENINYPQPSQCTAPIPDASLRPTMRQAWSWSSWNWLELAKLCTPKASLKKFMIHYSNGSWFF